MTLVADWWVDEKSETLSDHRYIMMELDWNKHTYDSNRRSLAFPKWNAGKLNVDLLLASIEGRLWTPPQSDASPRIIVKWLEDTLERASNTSMPRAKKVPGRPPVYWWNHEIELIRGVCVSRRRSWTRTKRNAAAEVVANMRAHYKKARGDLRKAIWKAKCAAWNDLLSKLEEDPWGKPYKIVIKKHTVAGPLVCESLAAIVLDRIVDTLFPRHEVTPSEEMNFE